MAAITDTGTEALVESLTRAQFDNYYRDVYPEEQRVLESVTDPRTAVANRQAEADLAGGVIAARAAQGGQRQARDIARTSLALDASEVAALNRSNDLSTALAKANAENLTRRTLANADTQLLGDLSSRGYQAMTNSLANLGNVAAQQAQRRAANQPISGFEAIYGTAGTLIGGYIGGPTGAQIGGQIGSGLGGAVEN